MARRKQIVNIPKKLILLIIICIVIAVIFICKGILKKDNSNNNSNTNIELNISDYKDYELPVAYYYNGLQNRNFETFLKAYPDFMGISSQFSANDLNNYYEQYKEECGENVTLSYEIGEAVSYAPSEIEDLKKNFKTNYGVDIDISEAYIINVKVKYTGDKNTVESNKKHTVFKYNGQWYSL